MPKQNTKDQLPAKRVVRAGRPSPAVESRPHPDSAAGIQAAVNGRDYASLLSQLDELKGSYAGLYLLEAAGNSDQGLKAILIGLNIAAKKRSG
jgi:hypothetical protein